MTQLSRVFSLFALLALSPVFAFAHEVRPGYLELREVDSGVFSTTWKVPARGEYHLAIEPVYPDFCHPVEDSMTLSRGRELY
jgi:hypothetical protein